MFVYLSIFLNHEPQQKESPMSERMPFISIYGHNHFEETEQPRENGTAAGVDSCTPTWLSSVYSALEKLNLTSGFMESLTCGNRFTHSMNCSIIID